MEPHHREESVTMAVLSSPYHRVCTHHFQACGNTNHAENGVKRIPHKAAHKGMPTRIMQCLTGVSFSNVVIFRHCKFKQKYFLHQTKKFIINYDAGHGVMHIFNKHH